MKKILKYTVFAAAAMFAMAACKGYTEEEATLTSDRTEIVADGSDAVTFAVEFNGQDVTDEAVITNVTSGEQLDGNVFTATEAGAYRFKAAYSGVESLTEVSVTATQATLVLTAAYVSEGDAKIFTFTAVYGTRDISTESELKIIDEATGERVEQDTDGYYRVTTYGDEQAVFRGEWNGNTSPPVIAGPLNFYRRVSILEFTGTWCQYCPQMAGYIKGVEDTYPDRIVLLAVHGGSSDKLTTPYGTTLAERFKASTFPAATLDFGSVINNTQTSTSDMERRVREIVEAGPADCGIAISASAADGKASVKVTLISAETMEYGLAVILAEDGITGYPQKMPDGSMNNNYVHDHTLREVYRNNIDGESVGQVTGGQQVERSFEFDLTGYEADNCRIMVIATTQKDGVTAVVNAADCKMGESVGWSYEE